MRKFYGLGKLLENGNTRSVILVSSHVQMKERIVFYIAFKNRD